MPASARSPLALIVEDDPLAANLLRMVLENDGFRVATAASAEEGLETAAREKPDVIALDIMLPGMSGWDFLARIKAQPQLADIPVVIETVLSQTEKGTALGAARVLQKPLRRADLEDALNGMGFGLRRPGERLRVLVVDDDEKTVRLLANYLQADGMEVLEAYGGAEAIETARREHPNLLVLDLMMPEVSGFDVVEALKDDPSLERMPILIVTAKETTVAERTALNGYVQNILEKSKFDRRHFLNEVRRAVNVRSAAGDLAHGTHPGR
ncbi:MAG: response regulator [Betaproteobacteria bacterium]|nr:response regulator [Betaproteobacteria bacterium]